MTEQSVAKHRHVPLLAKLVLVVVGMFAFGYALVPMYRWICDVTGLQGYINTDQAAPTEVDESRLVTVEFVANVNGRGPWQFRPSVSSMQVHPGEIYTTSYVAENTTDQLVAGQANYNVSPGLAGRYFGKPDCFCFTRQVFEANERRDLPVTFFVSTNLPRDVDTLTLSYTFFELPE